MGIPSGIPALSCSEPFGGRGLLWVLSPGALSTAALLSTVLLGATLWRRRYSLPCCFQPGRRVAARCIRKACTPDYSYSRTASGYVLLCASFLTYATTIGSITLNQVILASAHTPITAHLHIGTRLARPHQRQRHNTHQHIRHSNIYQRVQRRSATEQQLNILARSTIQST